MKLRNKIKEFDKFAEDYDEVLKGFDDDLKFYIKECCKTKGKILEIGCGTGRIYLELLKKGLDAYGIDISNKMLKKLKLKAKKMKLTPKVFQMNMNNFKINKKFSLIIIPFRTFLLNETIKEQLETLKNIFNHLEKNGILILNFFSPSPDVLMKTKEKPFSKEQGTFFVDKINQIIKMNSKIGNKIRSYNMAFIYKREFELLLILSGFKKYKVYGGFNKEKLTSFNQEMVWIIKKRKK